MNGCWQEVAQNLSQCLDSEIKFISKTLVTGGCINQGWQLVDQHKNSWFVKINSPSSIDMFMAEARGLNEIAYSNTINVPKVYNYGVNKEFSYLILEMLSLRPYINANKTGSQLAKMHKIINLPKDKNSFGWIINNTIGTTVQSNKRHNKWYSFYKNERLEPQLTLAKRNDLSARTYEDGLLLASGLHYFFTQYNPKASLLHGDLWSGNCATDQSSNPIIFDPAVYYGDRETDIAMTELFGGFSSDFYASYNNEYSLDQGYKVRKHLYNLYHILNHYNLFGGSYALQAGSITKKLLAEIK